MNKSNYREPFLALMADGKKRTVKEIAEALAMPETSNPNVFLQLLKARLIYERASFRLKCRTRQERGLPRERWIESK